MMRKRLLKFKFIILITVIAVFLPLGVLVADNLVADGDNAAPVADNPLNLGTISTGSNATGNVLLAVKRAGSASGTNTFGNSKSLVVSFVSSNNSLVTASMSDSAIATPSNWTTVANNTLTADTAASAVTATIPSNATPGSYTANLTYRVEGLNSSGSSINRTVVLVVNFTIAAAVIPNSAPVVTAPSNQTTDEGLATSINLGSFTDTDSTGPWSVDVNWGDGSAVETYSIATAGSLGSRSHTYLDDSTYTVIVDVTDEDAAKGSATFTVTANNVAPVMTAPANQTTDEGLLTSINLGSFSDTYSTGPWIVDIDWGDGSTSQTFNVTADGSLGARNHAYTDNGNYTVAVAVTDEDAGKGSASFTVAVINVDPVLGNISGPAEPVQIGTLVNLSDNFTDQGTLDTHTASWNWGDGQISAGIVNELNGSGSVTGGKTYTVPGVYEVSLTVTDKDGGSATSWFRYIVVYDPNGGFVTGGGWIDSPAGAYMADPTLTGKANFGFVSKYLKGATIPTGNTEFQFKAGSLNFQSSNYDWLVVAGMKAMYKGTGTINGSGNYGFILSAVDSRTGDQFRIRIWDKDTGATIYDNKSELAAFDSTSDLTTISGGSIVVHTKK